MGVWIFEREITALSKLYTIIGICLIAQDLCCTYLTGQLYGLCLIVCPFCLIASSHYFRDNSICAVNGGFYTEIALYKNKKSGHDPHFSVDRKRLDFFTGRKGLKRSLHILDHMGSTELAANLFRATQTEEKLRKEDIQDKQQANRTHFEVDARLWKTIE